MFTDMVGYTALGQNSEALSLALLNEQRKLLRPIFKRHGGHEINVIGDGFLVEFQSSLDATRCAYDIQRATREYTISLPDEKRFAIRVGVHVGDVIESKNGDISGDAVNVASRIESLAEHGGVCITRQVYDHIQNKFELSLEALGSKSLKNVKNTVEVFKMVMPWESEKKESSGSDNNRIAILPFTNMSPDPNDEFFADGLTEEVIWTISKIRELSVISRTSAMRYKKSNKSATEIGRELNVGRILEGSVRKSGNKLRITVQLIDAPSEKHIWAESYDSELRDIFEIQSDIAQRISESMEAYLLDSDRIEIERGVTRNLEAHSSYLHGLYLMNRSTKEGMLKAIEYLNQAVTIDPKFALAFSALADCYTYMAGQHMPAKECFLKAKEFARKALMLDEHLAEGHASIGIVSLQYDWDWEKTRVELIRAIELNPNYSIAHLWYGSYLLSVHRIFDALNEFRKAEDLDPLSPLVKLKIGAAFYFTGKYDEAISKLMEAKEMEEKNELVYLDIGLSYLAKSMYDKAISELKSGLAVDEDSNLLGALGYAYAISGKREEALAILKRLQDLKERAFGPSTNSASIYIGLGEYERAIDLLERAVSDREEWFLLSYKSHIYNPVRSDLRFRELMRKMGLPVSD